MGHYIDKDNLEAFLNELRENLDDSDFDRGYLCAIDSIFGCYLNTIEVKDVDFEKELGILDNAYFEFNGVMVKGTTIVEELKVIAKHFFELGMAVSNKQIEEKDI